MSLNRAISASFTACWTETKCVINVKIRLPSIAITLCENAGSRRKQPLQNTSKYTSCNLRTTSRISTAHFNGSESRALSRVGELLLRAELFSSPADPNGAARAMMKGLLDLEHTFFQTDFHKIFFFFFQNVLFKKSTVKRERQI